MSNILSRLLLVAVLSVTPLLAIAQPDWPTKPIRVTVGYGPGGPADVIMRGLASKLSSIWGQPVVIINKPGANEILAALEVVKQEPDGYNLILGTDALYSLNNLLRSKAGYDAEKGLAPIGRVGQSPLGLFVRPDFPAKDLKGFIAYTKSNAGKLNYASTGNGGITHLAVAWMSKLYGLDINQVPYNAVPQLMQDLSQGRVDMTMLAPGPLMPFADTQKLRALAVAGPSRLVIAPNVPTFAESGFPEFESFFYLGLAAPFGTPADILSKISADVALALNDDEVIKILNSAGFQPIKETPADFASFLKKDRISAAERIKIADPKLE